MLRLVWCSIRIIELLHWADFSWSADIRGSVRLVSRTEKLHRRVEGLRVIVRVILVD